MPICSNFPGRRQDLLSSTASSQPVKNLGAGMEGTNGEGTWFWGCGWVMGETHQDRGYRYLFWLGKEGRLYIFWEDLHFLDVFLQRHLLLIEKRHDDAHWLLKPRWTTSRFWIRHPMPLCRGQAKGLENGVLKESENTKFVGKIGWFRILFVARIRYYWEFRRAFLHFVLDTNEYGGGTFPLRVLLEAQFGNQIHRINCPLPPGYVWCMRSLPRKFEKKVSQWNKKNPVKIAKLVIFFHEMAGCIPWASRCTYRGAKNTNSVMGRQLWNGWVCWSGGIFFGDQFYSSEKEQVVDVCMKTS